MRKFRWLPAAALLAGMSILGATSLQAAIVTVISDGIPADTVILTSPGNTLVGTYTIDGYSGNIDVVSTNFPGSPAQGTLTTTTTVNNVTSAAPLTLTITSGVYTDETGTTLATFTAPTGATLNLKNDVTANGSSLGSTGSISGTSFGNGTPVGPNSVIINATTESASTGTFAGQAGTGYYTLTNTSVIAGLTLGDSGLSLAVASTVTAPEPSTLVVALSGVGLAGLGALRRLRNRA